MSDLVERAYEPYVPRIGRRPAPMDSDYAELIDRGAVWVAEGDPLTGIIVLMPREDHLLIENVAVAPEAQGQGIGSALLAFAEHQARASGISELRLYTNELMTENLSFYPRRGFEKAGRAQEAGFARVYFRKRLES